MPPAERQKLIAQYLDGFDEVQRALADFPLEQLTARPLPGKWSACEIVQHLADSEMRGAIRLRQLLAEERPAVQAYDQDVYAERLNYNARDIAPALDAFRAARATTAQLLAHMTDTDWAREGTHPDHPRYTTDTWLEVYAAHAHNHAAQIRRLREALKAEVRG
ncbi:MAG TPA: DinB family protein [Pyrinomonadaceae bacterium]|nr:DinB family protein [Pyrinomonadaceae bacterium]